MALTALTGSLTQQAFNPTFLSGLDSAVARVSTSLHDSLFVSWIPAVLALLGVMIIFKARRASMATSAAAIGWALIVVLVTTALFRWPTETGQAADATVTGTLGAVVNELDGNGRDVDPGTAVASGVSESIFYRAWLAGTLGSPDSKTARTYGPDLFQAQALTWQEAAILERDPDEGREIIEDKQEAWKETAETIQDEDPEAYEYLTGRRSETRIGYAVLSATAAILALPFLLISALLLVGCFLIVRLGVMLFPAFATLGAFPASRGLVIGLGRTVGAAVVNAIIFGIGAGITVAVLGILFNPGGSAPGWLGLVLMPVFGLVMWVALRPFRRLTSMVSPNSNTFGDMADAVGQTSRGAGGWAKGLAIAGATGGASGIAAGVSARMGKERAPQNDEQGDEVPDRAEARPSRVDPPKALNASHVSDGRDATRDDPNRPPPNDERHKPSRPRTPPSSVDSSETPAMAALPAGFVPVPTATSDAPPSPTGPEWDDGEEVYTIYRPSEAEADASSH